MSSYYDTQYPIHIPIRDIVSSLLLPLCHILRLSCRFVSLMIQIERKKLVMLLSIPTVSFCIVTFFALSSHSTFRLSLKPDQAGHNTNEAGRLIATDNTVSRYTQCVVNEGSRTPYIPPSRHKRDEGEIHHKSQHILLPHHGNENEVSNEKAINHSMSVCQMPRALSILRKKPS